MKPRKLIAALFCLATFTSTARADGELAQLLRPQDEAALSTFDATKAKAIAGARTGGATADVKALDSALAGSPLPFGEGFDATGQWKCRTIKLGGGLPIVVYPAFKCSISDDGAGWFLKKLTGSQRTQGRFYTESDTRLIYLGAGFVAGESAGTFGPANKDSAIAVVERLAPQKLVLQFPAPVYESDFDLLVLER